MLNEKHIILDCNYLAHRAKYVFGDLSYAGSATGVIYGFLKDVISLMERFNTQNLIFCWDSNYKKRKEILPTYKAKRKKKRTKEEKEFDNAFYLQMCLLRDRYLFTIGFRNVFIQRGYEADDIIAIICKSVIGKKDEATIVTADQDLFQLIDTNIKWFNPRTLQTITLGKFKKEFGIHPRKWAKVKAIAGCTSDNVKGIKGVGDLTAVKYIRNELPEKSKKYKAIKKGWHDIVLRNRKLVELPYEGTKVPVLNSNNLNQDAWDMVTKELGMKSIRFTNII